MSSLFCWCFLCIFLVPHNFLVPHKEANLWQLDQDSQMMSFAGRSAVRKGNITQDKSDMDAYIMTNNKLDVEVRGHRSLLGKSCTASNCVIAASEQVESSWWWLTALLSVQYNLPITSNRNGNWWALDRMGKLLYCWSRQFQQPHANVTQHSKCLQDVWLQDAAIHPIARALQVTYCSNCCSHLVSAERPPLAWECDQLSTQDSTQSTV